MLRFYRLYPISGRDFILHAIFALLATLMLTQAQFQESRSDPCLQDAH